MNTTEIRTALKNELLSVCDNVHDIFVYPDEFADMQSEFPYITLILNQISFEGGTKRGIRNISIIGIVKGNNDDLMEKRDKLEADIFTKLYKNCNVTCNIIDIESQNIFKPFGLEAGIFPPYAGTLINIQVPETMVSIS